MTEYTDVPPERNSRSKRVIAVHLDEVRELGPTAAIVLQQVRWFGDNDDAFDREGWVTRSHAEWSRLTGLSVDTVFRTLRKLVALGLVEQSGPGNRARSYRVDPDRDIADLADPVRDIAEPGSRNRGAGSAESRTAPLYPDALDLTEDRVAPVRAAPSFDAFWSVYPRHVGKQDAKNAWDVAIKRAAPEVIIEGARRYRDDPNRDDTYTKHPGPWLRAGRWEDDPLPSRNGGKRGETSAQKAARLQRMNDEMFGEVR